MKNLLGLILISELSILVPVISWILFVRRASPPLYFILAGILLGGLEEIVLWIMALRYGNNLIAINLYSVPSLLLLYAAYLTNPGIAGPIRRVMGITGLAGLLAIIYFLVRKDLYQLITINLVILSIALILLALYYFIHKVFYSREFDILHHPFFYISCGIFVYYLSVLSIFSTYDMKLRGYEMLWAVKTLFFIFYNLTLAYSFIIFRKYRNSL